MEMIGVSLESFPVGAKQKDYSLQPIEVKERKRNWEEQQKLLSFLFSFLEFSINLSILLLWGTAEEEARRGLEKLFVGYSTSLQIQSHWCVFASCS